MDILWFMIGIFGTGVFFAMAGFIIFVIWYVRNNRYNKMIRITNKTAGKDSIEIYQGRVFKHKTLGDVYEIPALKKEDRQYAPYYGREYEYPISNKSKKMYVALTFLNGTYAPERFDHEEVREIDVIEKRYGDLSEKEYFALSPEVRLKDKSLYKVKFHKVSKKVTTYVIKPTKNSMRQFNLEMDTSIKEDFLLNPSWWEKHGALVVALGIVAFAAIVAIIMIIFAYQWGVDISSAPPAWVSGFLEQMSTNGAAAPPAGVAP